MSTVELDDLCLTVMAEYHCVAPPLSPLSVLDNPEWASEMTVRFMQDLYPYAYGRLWPERITAETVLDTAIRSPTWRIDYDARWYYDWIDRVLKTLRVKINPVVPDAKLYDGFFVTYPYHFYEWQGQVVTLSQLARLHSAGMVIIDCVDAPKYIGGLMIEFPMTDTQYVGPTPWYKRLTPHRPYVMTEQAREAFQFLGSQLPSLTMSEQHEEGLRISIDHLIRHQGFKTTTLFADNMQGHLDRAMDSCVSGITGSGPYLVYPFIVWYFPHYLSHVYTRPWAFLRRPLVQDTDGTLAQLLVSYQCSNVRDFKVNN